ncbi:hypothetical protein [Mycolicibacterium elephantis]|uniref:Uncharacterized protein n=1 Tax=Mycolicibacterium elephantis DSM 44368 TaxID=1335622 RepID=A0A439E0M3_9MYCO|nr:hypothetical protein [Mycolicibacterium elephantis]MCV7221545.1 hypothetical protein [Mycolicibacterium elephantis]RWA23983.1 hypothetical protein MELE44368_01875 [Mycolicibacterium elephantis DSM 44368]
MSDEWEHIDLGTMTCGGCKQTTGAWVDRRKGSTEDTVSIDCKCGHVNVWQIPTQ